MVYRIFVEKKAQVANEAKALLSDFKTLLGIDTLDNLRVFNRYDVEKIDQELFEYCKYTVFAEPQLDIVSSELPQEDAKVFAVEYLPGQFDQRADSASQCIQIISKKERPIVKTAKVYMLYGNLTEQQLDKINKYVVNPVESRLASLEKPDTLTENYSAPTQVQTLDGFLALDEKGLLDFVKNYGLAMDLDDVRFCQQYFKQEGREPTVTEIRVIDTYWSDHCRHTTFLTTIDSVKFDDQLLQKAFDEYLQLRKSINRTKPVNLMDIATIGAKYLKQNGYLTNLDESEEINACTVKMQVNVDGKTEDWLLLFKNETHNHPTEIEPFGGAATCVGGAIRDPLSGRSYVYGAMRLSGASDPLKPVEETLKGKLPQRKIVTSAASGYSSYGNQIGLATGQVDEIYHDGYVAKHMEIGAVIGAAPAENVKREKPVDGDVIILLGGKTGRDGCGGATGSSKSHDVKSIETCGAEVQKGNPPEERKLQRLFRNKEASMLIKRCNDFGAGGVSVAIGELADGLDIDLNAVPKKYEGLDGTELAISESQERMAVVVSDADVQKFLQLVHEENLEATIVARVKAEPRLTMRWNGKNIVDISREFLNSNGAEKHVDVHACAPQKFDKQINGSFAENLLKTAGDLNVCSKKGLVERFDSTIGANTVLMPFGGKYQATPIQAMVHKVAVEKGHTDTVSLMAWGYNPFIAEKSPYHGAYLAVVESVSKLIATGADFKDVYLTFQEYFEKLGKDSCRWGKPFSALLGALKAQIGLKVPAIGGKDSMSGSFEDLHVPPTLVSFAVTTDNVDNIVANQFKQSGNKVVLLRPEFDSNGLPTAESLLKVYNKTTELLRSGKAVSAYTPTYGGIAEAVMKMSFGNGLSFAFDDTLSTEDIFGYNYGAMLLEVTCDCVCNDFTTIGIVTDDGKFTYRNETVLAKDVATVYETKLEPIYPCNIIQTQKEIPVFDFNAKERFTPLVKVAKPKVLIPVFPGTNCEYDSAKAMADAGADTEIFIVKNLSADDISYSVEKFVKSLKTSQIVFIPGGFSGGDEPDGSGKFITAFFRNPEIKQEVTALLEKRDGLMCGICNGFQALIKLGLVPYGKIIDVTEDCPTLTYNTIARHQSMLVRTRVASNKSPWLKNTKVGQIFTVPVSHGEGRFFADEKTVLQLAQNGQIATQYVDLSGKPTADVRFNPNNSVCAIEGITSPDGRVFGKMGHSERIGYGLYKNVYANYDMQIFRSAVEYFKN